MTESPTSLDLHLEPADSARLAALCGQFDEHLRHIERRLGVEINNRGNHFRLIGDDDSVRAAGDVLNALYAVTAEQEIDPHKVNLFLQDSGIEAMRAENGGDDAIEVKTRRGTVRGRGANQQRYLANILSNDLNFGIGPAGTGKTYLAVACAVHALEHDRVRRIVLVRPAVEAGERLGFLPGDMAQKVDPYLRPLYDALYEMMGFEQVARLIDRHVIEIAPLAFMRGRSLSDSFIILDEAQNATMEQMKMFLTRIGFGSVAVVTGDITQVDLPRHQHSGLRHVTEVLKDIDGISFTFFNQRDVVRHPLVQRVVAAYERFEDDSGERDA